MRLRLQNRGQPSLKPRGIADRRIIARLINIAHMGESGGHGGR
jgi:hypothetical protein